MPKSRYFGGKGASVYRKMQKKYGKKKAGNIFYGTVVNMQKGTKAQRAAQPTRRKKKR
jgi:hypothetical protein